MKKAIFGLLILSIFLVGGCVDINVNNKDNEEQELAPVNTNEEKLPEEEPIIEPVVEEEITSKEFKSYGADRGMEIVSQEYPNLYQFSIVLRNRNKNQCGMFCYTMGGDREIIETIEYGDVHEFVITLPREVYSFTKTSIICSDLRYDRNSPEYLEQGCDNTIKQVFRL